MILWSEMICSYSKANPKTHVPCQRQSSATGRLGICPICQLPSSGADPTRKTAGPGFVSLHSTLNFSMEDMARSSQTRFNAAHHVLKTNQVVWVDVTMPCSRHTILQIETCRHNEFLLPISFAAWTHNLSSCAEPA